MIHFATFHIKYIDILKAEMLNNIVMFLILFKVWFICVSDNNWITIYFISFLWLKFTEIHWYKPSHLNFIKITDFDNISSFWWHFWNAQRFLDSYSCIFNKKSIEKQHFEWILISDITSDLIALQQCVVSLFVELFKCKYMSAE